MNSAVHSAADIAHSISTAQMYAVFADFTTEIKILFSLGFNLQITSRFLEVQCCFLFVTLQGFPHCSKHLQMSVKGSFISSVISCKTCDSACHLNLLLCVLRGHRTLLQPCSSCTLSTSYSVSNVEVITEPGVIITLLLN